VESGKRDDNRQRQAVATYLNGGDWKIVAR